MRHGPCPNEEVPRASSFFDAMCCKGSSKWGSGDEIGLPRGRFFMVFVSPFFMVLVSPPTEYCYFNGFTTSRGPEIRARKCRPAKGGSIKNTVFSKRSKNVDFR